MTKTRIAFALLMSGLLTACGSGLEGTYEDEAGLSSYEFHPNGTVDISVFGATVRGDYEVEKDRVLITGPQGTIVFVRKDDALEGPMGLQLQRRPSS